MPDLGDFDNFLSEDSSRDTVREERSLQEGEVSLNRDSCFQLFLVQVSSDEEDGGNPMVARYDDIVSKDFPIFLSTSLHSIKKNSPG